MLKNKNLIILDLDDTLIDTSDIYFEARKSFVELFNGSFPKKHIINTFEKIDTANFNIYGYDPIRYYMSMKDTYKTLVSSNGLQDSIPNIKKCYNLLFSKPKLISGAIELLDFFRKGGVTVCLITRGKEEFQNLKIDSVDIRHYFDFIKIVDSKDSILFKEVISSLNFTLDETLSIGDSFKSDIIPSLELNIDCIKYNYSHSEYEWLQDKIQIESKGYIEVNNLSEIISFGT
jgi:putative hydrolase of the HAD superfamily